MAAFAMDNGCLPGMKAFSTVRFAIEIAESTSSGNKPEIQYIKLIL